MESALVIKVKYGETLRRFSACILDGELDFDMDGLRDKVLRLFNFAANAELTFTYIDEDGDVVTLADEEDLRDVVRQSLNPLRITVRLNTEKSGRSYARSSGSPTPMRSPRVQNPLNTSVSEILKSVSGPLGESVSKLQMNLALDPTSSPPGLAELVDSLSRMGLTYLKQVATGAESSTQSGASGSTMAESVIKDKKGSNVEGGNSEMLPNAKSEVPNQSEVNFPTLDSNQVKNLGKVTRGAAASVTPPPASLYHNVDVPGDNISSGCASTNSTPDKFRVAVDGKEDVKKLGEGHLNGKSDVSSYANVTPVVTSVPDGDKNKEFKKSVGASTNPLDYLKRALDYRTTDLGGGLKKCSSASGNSSGSRLGPYPVNECPFSGMFLENDSAVPPQYAPSDVPFKSSFNHINGIGSIFHCGVRCDGCGVHPITGPRFISKVKEDFDLCRICFSEMGNEADYVRMDRPVTYRSSLSFKGLHDPMKHCRVRPPTLPPRVLRGCGMKLSGPKLDSRFIQDVNILDGTIMTPSTPFTKIWRMKNNGTITWPRGTQLLWIGGDRLSETISVELEIPADGLPVDKELEIRVDFSAPELPGRYISYWRMASPSGHKFGQRVWVLIQVDSSLKNSWHERIHGFNLNLPPPVSGGATGPQAVNVNVEPLVEECLPEPDNSNRATELVEPIVYAHPKKEQELNFPINDTLLVGGDESKSAPPEGVSSSVSYPIIDLSEVAPTVPAPPQSPAMDVEASAQGVRGKNEVEQTLLRELEEMGFKQVDLNKEILRMNEYNLEQSVDDLCGVAEWDPLLAELQEMGFYDSEMNKRLLKKNNGSIKRVVMDLVTREKA